jgi:signal transduction histidine kinase
MRWTPCRRAERFAGNRAKQWPDPNQRGRHGKGIPTIVRAEIFRPFFSTKSSGTGLGLPLARRAVEENGGTLVLTPERAGSGTEFVIEFPLRKTVYA